MLVTFASLSDTLKTSKDHCVQFLKTCANARIGQRVSKMGGFTIPLHRSRLELFQDEGWIQAVVTSPINVISEGISHFGGSWKCERLVREVSTRRVCNKSWVWMKAKGEARSIYYSYTCNEDSFIQHLFRRSRQKKAFLKEIYFSYVTAVCVCFGHVRWRTGVRPVQHMCLTSMANAS